MLARCAETPRRLQTAPLPRGATTSRLPRGMSGKVLKRELRDAYADPCDVRAPAALSGRWRVGPRAPLPTTERLPRRGRSWRRCRSSSSIVVDAVGDGGRGDDAIVLAGAAPTSPRSAARGRRNRPGSRSPSTHRAPRRPTPRRDLIGADLEGHRLCRVRRRSSFLHRRRRRSDTAARRRGVVASAAARTVGWASSSTDGVRRYTRA